MVEYDKIGYDISGSCGTLAEVPVGATVVCIDGIDVIGVCESCPAHILAGQPYHEWQDGIKTCIDCGGPEER